MSQKINESSVVADAYNMSMSIIADLTQTMVMKGYYAIQSFLFSGTLYSLIGIIICIWLFMHLKEGAFPKESLWKACIWVITFVFIYVIMGNTGAFNEFRNWVLVPQQIVFIPFSAIFENAGNMGEMLNEPFVKAKEAYSAAWSYAYNPFNYTGFGMCGDGKGPIDETCSTLNKIGIFFSLILWGIYILMVLIIAIGVTIFQLATNFMLTVFSLFLPLCLPLMLIPQTRGHFFAWLKTFIGLSFYVPLSLIPLGLLNHISNMALNGMNQNSLGKELWNNCFYYGFIGCLFALIAIYLFLKIPTWVSQIMGVQDSGGGFGIGASVAMLGAGGSLAGNIGKRILAGKAGGSLASGATGGIANAVKNSSVGKGANAGKNIGATLGSIGGDIGAGIGGMAGGAMGATGGAAFGLGKGLYKAGRYMAKDGFKAMGKFLSGSD